MNKITGIVRKIKTDEGLSWIALQVENLTLSAMMIEAAGRSLPLQEGDAVVVAFKETSMSIGKDLSGELSIRNRFDVVITSLTKSNVLTKLMLDFHGRQLVSVITTASAEQMQLAPGDRVTGLVKTTDMILMKKD